MVAKYPSAQILAQVCKVLFFRWLIQHWEYGICHFPTISPIRYYLSQFRTKIYVQSEFQCCRISATDFLVYKELAGLSGLDFAYADNIAVYHTKVIISIPLEFLYPCTFVVLGTSSSGICLQILLGLYYQLVLLIQKSWRLHRARTSLIWSEFVACNESHNRNWDNLFWGGNMLVDVHENPYSYIYLHHACLNSIWHSGKFFQPCISLPTPCMVITHLWFEWLRNYMFL